MQQVEVFNLGELTERLLILQGRSSDEVWAEEKNALFRQLERAAASQKLRVRHPETLLPQVFAEWAPPSSGCLVSTIADVNAWLVSEGVPYSMTPLPDSTAAQPQAVPVEAPPVVAVVALDGEAWANNARERAAEIIKRQREKDLYPSQINIADEIAREFRAAGTVGTGGKPLSGAYIKRHALNGISSAQGKQLSTRTGRGK